jgi:hypothetical protein
LSKDSHKGCAKTPELILLDQLVEINAQQLENQAEMLAMDECIFQSQEMMVIVLVELGV